MRNFLSISNVISTQSSNSNFWLSTLSNSALLLILSAALLYSSGAIAANNEISGKSQLVLNDDKTTSPSKVNISYSKMTPENKKTLPVADAQIGSFSMEDGAMMGHYGDGEYSD